MKQSLLYPLFKKLRPNMAQLDSQRAVEAFLELFTIIYLTPFAFAGLVWVFWASDLSMIISDFWGLLMLFLGLLIIDSRPASIPLSLGEKASTTITITLSSILLWMGMLIWGPVTLVIDLLVVLVLRIRESWWLSRYSQDVGWAVLPSSLQEITYTALTNMIGFSVYLALGGTIPLESTELIDWLPILVGIGVNAVMAATILLPVIIYINHFSKISNSLRSLGAFILTVAGVLLVTTPFSIPFALIYTRIGPVAHLFAMFGLVLVNLLLHYLSRINQQSQQRTREMTQLEALGEEIIQSSPDGSTLGELLETHVKRMFHDPRDMIEIRVFEWLDLPGFAGDIESLNFTHPTHQTPAPDSLWGALRQTTEPYLLIKDMIPPEAKAVYGDAIIDKITSAAPTQKDDAPLCIGGVYLLRHKRVAKTIDSLPAVQALASQVASALYRAQVHNETLAANKMAQELEFAGNIQASFLPDEVPAVDGWGIAASLTPARQTAGDFYDFIPLGDGKLGVVVADVADKGTGAALYMALSRTLIRTHAMQFPNNPAEALRLANERILADTRANQFVTVFYGVLDLNTGEMTYCNAGHNPAFVIRAADPEAHESYIRTGAPMGIFGDLEWEEGIVRVGVGDIVLLYSDGVNEAQNLAEEFYDYDRFLAVTKSHFAGRAPEIHTAVMDSVRDFVGQAPQFDDITLMVLKREAD